ncbi:rhamnogalacturonidase [Asticcacaulis biprosthecium]|uniref:rhamnogalacturonidase n=1 Tax=Asticcacaulis biprosthecium TaxID=76891 RepID=UPI0035AC01EB
MRDFGARGDGTTIDTPAVNAAIDHLASRGGGTLYFPAGSYACYTIRLKSHIRLYLDAGAVIVAAPTPIEGMTSGGYDQDVDLPESYRDFQDHGHGHWRNSLIWGEGLNDIAIEGPGLIWGKGLGRGHDYDKGMPISGRPGVGDKAIALKLCRNVLLRDFRMLQAGWFGLLATGVDNLTIDNLLIDTNRDGLDIDCCKNVRISNCTINSPWDDAICPKSSYALGYPRATENVTITNCYVSGSYVIGSVLDGSYKVFLPEPKGTHGRIKLGTESNGGFRNITISNIVFDKCRGIALETVDGAHLEDITITNISMREVTTAPIFLRLGRRMRGPAGVVPGTLKRVIISNITSSAAAIMPSIIAGVEGYKVEDIRISDMFLQSLGGADPALASRMPPLNEAGYPEPNMFGDLPASGLFVRQARNIELDHIEFQTQKPDPRPVFWLQDVDGFRTGHIRRPIGATVFTQRVTGMEMDRP